MNPNEEKKKSSKTVKICVVFIAIFAILGLLAGRAIYLNSPKVIMQKRIDAFNQLADGYKKGFPQGVSDWDLLAEVGLSNCSGDRGYTMDEEFVDAYIEKLSVEEFIEKLYKINEKFVNEKTGKISGESCPTQISRINNALKYALEVAGIEMSPVKVPVEGTEGYYTEHPEKVPKEYIWPVFSADNHSDRRERYVEVAVMGDFVMEHETGWAHVGSKLGWENGVFYDQYGHWETLDEKRWYYKGNCISEEQKDGMMTFDIGGSTYSLYGAVNTKDYCCSKMCNLWVK